MRVELWLISFFLIFFSFTSDADTLSFDEAKKLAQAQPQDVTNGYYDKWDPVNNANHLDEKDGCYLKSRGVVQQVLILDKNGVVVDVLADSNSEKAQCFRTTYLHYKFPEPPFFPYYVYLQMN